MMNAAEHRKIIRRRNGGSLYLKAKDVHNMEGYVPPSK